MFDISIIIPVYCATNESLGWLEECLSSTDMQECDVVVHDDGSPLQSEVVNIVKRHAVTYFTIGNHVGVSNARNVCVRNAKTSLVYPLDCDDVLKPGAMALLSSKWTGIPLYSDIYKFGTENVMHFEMLNFDCTHVLKYVGFTSVNVLHSKYQWERLGGWDETLDFYEDGEYNARLYGTYCGERVPFPLVGYRQHDSQRTKKFDEVASKYATKILSMIRSYTMGCKTCGGKGRRSATNAPGVVNTTPAARSSAQPVSIGTNVLNLPLDFQGKVLAQYIGGKGQGKHYYRGIVSKFPYRVMYLDYLYVDPRDTTDDRTSQSRLLRIHELKTEQAQPAVVTKIEVVEQLVKNPVATVVEQPVKKVAEPKKVEPVVVDLPDITTMSVKKVFALQEDPNFNASVARQLLVAEKRGLNRAKVVAWLEARTND